MNQQELLDYIVQAVFAFVRTYGINPNTVIMNYSHLGVLQTSPYVEDVYQNRPKIFTLSIVAVPMQALPIVGLMDQPDLNLTTN